MAQTYIGKAALTLVRANGTLAYVHAGHPVPDGATSSELQRLTDEGYIVPLGEAAEVLAAEQPNPDLPVAGEDEVVELEAPAKYASKGDWEAFARSQGATDADLDGLTKDDLIAAYGD